MFYVCVHIGAYNNMRVFNKKRSFLRINIALTFTRTCTQNFRILEQKSQDQSGENVNESEY